MNRLLIFLCVCFVLILFFIFICPSLGAKIPCMWVAACEASSLLGEGNWRLDLQGIRTENATNSDKCIPNAALGLMNNTVLHQTGYRTYVTFWGEE